MIACDSAPALCQAPLFVRKIAHDEMRRVVNNIGTANLCAVLACTVARPKHKSAHRGTEGKYANLLPCRSSVILNSLKIGKSDSTNQANKNCTYLLSSRSTR